MQQVLEFIKKWKYAIGAAVNVIAALCYALWVTQCLRYTIWKNMKN